jgi:hypothetical protein
MGAADLTTMRASPGPGVAMQREPFLDVLSVLAMIATAGFTLAVHSSVRWGLPWDLSSKPELDIETREWLAYRSCAALEGGWWLEPMQGSVGPSQPGAVLTGHSVRPGGPDHVGRAP